MKDFKKGQNRRPKMFYDGFMDDEGEREDEEVCVICGVGARRVEGRYCSDSCAAEDEGYFLEEEER